jgi:hypothetical protein
MAKAKLAPETHSSNLRPHVVRRRIGEDYRYYVYAYRGGPCVFRQDSVRPTMEQARLAALGVHQPPDRKVIQIKDTKRGRGITAHRPLFIRELVRICAEEERWVYFISDSRGAVKVGAARCVRSRLKILQAHNASTLEVVAMVRGGELLESAYHSWFAPHRLNNEWFAMQGEVVAEIEFLNKLARTGTPTR